jgi:hypothetical protein
MLFERRDSEKRSANAAPLRVDRRKVEFFHDTFRLSPAAGFAPQEKGRITYCNASHDDTLSV